MGNENSYIKLWEELKKYFKTNVEYVKLTAAEKITVLFAAAAVALGVFFLAVFCLFFASFAVVNWLSVSLGVSWSYLIMSGVYLILIGLLILFRKPLIMNPIAKFVSRLLLK